MFDTPNIYLNQLTGSLPKKRRQSDRYANVTKDDAIDILDTFYSQGGNFIDTPKSYRKVQKV
jgi:aryl-alcohol dehydrogenase-like predicted oxidoreductase